MQGDWLLVERAEDKHWYGKLYATIYTIEIMCHEFIFKREFVIKLTMPTTF